MSDSISQQVIAFLKKNPNASNQELYDLLPGVRKNTIRDYKSKYLKASTTGKRPSKAAPKKTTTPKKQTTTKTLSGPIEDLEKRVSAIEEQIQKILVILQGNTETDSGALEELKSSLGVDGKIKELENNLLSFIKDKKGRVTSELHHLEDLQQAVSTKIAAFIRTIKKK